MSPPTVTDLSLWRQAPRGPILLTTLQRPRRSKRWARLAHLSPTIRHFWHIRKGL